MKGMKKMVIFAALVVIVCTTLVATVSATTLDFGNGNQLFSQKGGFSHILVNAGTLDESKAGFYQAYPISSFILIKPQANALYIRKTGSNNPVNYSLYRTTIPVSHATITPVPEQGIGTTTVPGSSNSTLGGLIIHGPEGDWINMRANFYSPSMDIYDGRWHYHVGTLPAYWENMALPGSYTIQIAHRDTDLVYYCETVMVYPGQITEIQIYNSMCPLCSSC